MKPLVVLLLAFVLAVAGTRIFSGDWNWLLSLSIGMSAMLLFTSIGHFAFTKGMVLMMPNKIPFKKPIVYITGLVEIVAAITLLFAQYRTATAWFLIVFFIVLLPANIHAAVKKVDYQKGNFTGAGLNYLWFRIPLQIFFIGWLCVIIHFSMLQ